jgi:hypothetical protein
VACLLNVSLDLDLVVAWPISRLLASRLPIAIVAWFAMLVPVVFAFPFAARLVLVGLAAAWRDAVPSTKNHPWLLLLLLLEKY